VFAAGYGLMAIAKDKEMIYAAFLLYGMFPSFTDGVSKAWISNITPKENTATALGFFTGVNSIFVLISSALAGLIWNVAGPSSVFVFSSLGAIAVMIYFPDYFRQVASAVKVIEFCCVFSPAVICNKFEVSHCPVEIIMCEGTLEAPRISSRNHLADRSEIPFKCLPECERIESV
jgi:MFS family permease